jgi:hypothetical protein
MLNTARITKVALALNAAAGTDKYDASLTVANIKEAIRSGTIMTLLESRLGHEAGLAILKEGDREEFLEEWRALVDNPKEETKLGVHRGGLNLLVAYMLWGIEWRCDQS